MHCKQNVKKIKLKGLCKKNGGQVGQKKKKKQDKGIIVGMPQIKENKNPQRNECWRYNGRYFDSQMVGNKTRYYCPIGSVVPNHKCFASARSNFTGWLSIGTLHKHKGKRRMSIFRKRILMWQEDKIDELWDCFKTKAKDWQRKQEMISQLKHGDKRKHGRKSYGKNKSSTQHEDKNRNDPSNKKYRTKKIERLVRNNDVKKATNFILSNGLCAMNENIKSQLKMKHPYEEQYKIQENELYQPQLRLNIKNLKEALARIKVTKAAGQNGWKPVYWKCIRDSIYDDRIRKKLLKLVNLCMNGFFGTCIGRQFAVTKGIPIAKDKGKTMVRPVAIGISLRKIITSMITNKINPKINGIVGNMNFGTVKNEIRLFSELMNCIVK